MAWLFDAGGNDGYNDCRNLQKVDGDRHGVILLPTKALAVAAGCTIIGSGDGASAHEWSGVTGGAGTGSGGSFDVWTSHGSGTGTAGDVSNTSSWCVIRFPTGAELLLTGTDSPGAGFDSYGYVDFSPADGFSSAGVGPSTPPGLPADVIRIRGGNFPGNSTQLISFTGDSYIHIGFQDAAVNGAWPWFWATYHDTGNVIFDRLGLAALDGPDTNDTAPWYVFGTDGSPGNAAAGTQNFRLVEIQGQGEAFETVFGSNNFAPNTLVRDAVPDLSNDSPFDATPYMWTLPYYRRFGVANEEYYAGAPQDVYGRGQAGLDYPDYFDVDGFRYVHWGQTCIPWGEVSSSPPDPLGNGAASDSGAELRRIEENSAGAVDGTPPVVNIFTDSALTSKNQIVAVTVSDDVALALVTVLIWIPSLNVTECAYHNGSFRAPYKSSTILGNTFFVQRDGGWPANFQGEATAIDTSGNLTS